MSGGQTKVCNTYVTRGPRPRRLFSGIVPSPPLSVVRAARVPARMLQLLRQQIKAISLHFLRFSTGTMKIFGSSSSSNVRVMPLDRCRISDVVRLVLLAAAAVRARSAETVEIKLRPNVTLATALGDDNLVFFEPYSPLPRDNSMTCSMECPCPARWSDPVDCWCDEEQVCRGTTDIELSAASELSFRWEAPSSTFISVKGGANDRFMMEFLFVNENCKAPHQDIRDMKIELKNHSSSLARVTGVRTNVTSTCAFSSIPLMESSI